MRCPRCGEEYEDAAFCPRDGTALHDEDGAPVDPMVGRIVEGRYRIDRRIGAGGFGVVYAAHQLNLDRAVAIKILPPALADDPGRRRRFFVESRAISRLESPHTVRVYDFGESADGVYLVMELLSGEPLDRRLARGPLTVCESLSIADGICAALAEAHDAGVVHRDIKPGNVFLQTVAGELCVKVLDFGIARMQAAQLELSGATSTGAVLGTPAYMSPEQALGRPVDGRADLYAVGVMLFEMIAGERPLVADGVPQLLLKHVHAPRPSLRDRCGPDTAPPGVDRLVQRLMARTPDERPASARDARTLLDAARSTVEPRAPSRPIAAVSAPRSLPVGPTGLAATVDVSDAGPPALDETLSRSDLTMRGALPVEDEARAAPRWAWALGGLALVGGGWLLGTLDLRPDDGAEARPSAPMARPPDAAPPDAAPPDAASPDAASPDAASPDAAPPDAAPPDAASPDAADDPPVRRARRQVTPRRESPAPTAPSTERPSPRPEDVLDVLKGRKPPRRSTAETPTREHR